MKKLMIIMCIGCLLLSSNAAIAIPQENHTLTINESFTFSSPTLIEHEADSIVILTEATTYLHNPGQPVLPVITKTYTFPIGTIISNIIYQPTQLVKKIFTKDVCFAQKPVIQSSAIAVSQTIKVNAVYSSSELYPSSWYDVHFGVGLKGTEHVLYVTIQMYPVRISPACHQIQYATEGNVRISYVTPLQPYQTTDTYDLIIIAPKAFSSSLQPLIDHKESHGIHTMLMTTEQIYQQYNGRDKAEDVKLFIQAAVKDFGAHYILLFGGMKGAWFWSWYVPVRYSNLDDASDFETNYLSDLYYADIYKYDNQLGYVFDDWDSNGNKVFAEWNSQNKDILDMYPDVYVGRLPCQSPREVTAIVNRIITYETTTFDQNWFKKIAVVGGDSFDDITWNTSTDYLEGQEENEQALRYMEDFEKTRIWVEGGNVTFTPENAVQTLSEGQGFVYFSGHGNPMDWATHPHAQFTTWLDFSLTSITQLTNGKKLPVLIVGGCHNSQFDVSRLKMFSRTALMWGDATRTCWGWLYGSQPNGGSIATIGNTGLGYGTIGDGPVPPDEIPASTPDGIPDCIQYLDGWMESHFFKVYHDDGKTRLGETHGQTLTDYLNQFPINWGMNWADHEQAPSLVDCKSVQEWILFGDPSLQIGGYAITD
jgi:hypothetical protein